MKHTALILLTLLFALPAMAQNDVIYSGDDPSLNVFSFKNGNNGRRTKESQARVDEVEEAFDLLLEMLEDDPDLAYETINDDVDATASHLSRAMAGAVTSFTSAVKADKGNAEMLIDAIQTIKDQVSANTKAIVQLQLAVSELQSNISSLSSRIHSKRSQPTKTVQPRITITPGRNNYTERESWTPPKRVSPLKGQQWDEDGTWKGPGGRDK